MFSVFFSQNAVRQLVQKALLDPGHLIFSHLGADILVSISLCIDFTLAVVDCAFIQKLDNNKK